MKSFPITMSNERVIENLIRENAELRVYIEHLQSYYGEYIKAMEEEIETLEQMQDRSHAALWETFLTPLKMELEKISEKENVK